MARSTSNKDFFESSDPTLLSGEETASQLLKRQFSTKLAISSQIQRTTDRSSSEQREDLRIIGLGSCGTIFKIPGTELVFKKGTSRPHSGRISGSRTKSTMQRKMSAPSCKETFPPPPSLECRSAINSTRPMTNTSRLRIQDDDSHPTIEPSSLSLRRPELSPCLKRQGKRS